MSVLISGIGLQVNVIASVTFPTGLLLTQWADDSDPFDAPSIQIGDVGMGLNGDLVRWAKANPIVITLNMIPNSEDDDNLAILLESNRAGRGKLVVNDVITMTSIYPDGSGKTYYEGMITDGIPSNSIASAQRMKSKSYTFKFENRGGFF